MIRKNRFLLSTISVASFVMKLLSGFDLFDIDALQLCNVLLIAVRYGRLFCSVQLHHSAAGADGACHFLTYQLDNGAAFKRAYNPRTADSVGGPDSSVVVLKESGTCCGFTEFILNYGGGKIIREITF